VAFAALWPFEHPFYRRFGYGRANDYCVHAFPPEALDTPAARASADGTFRRLSADDPDDVDALSTLHAESASEPLAIERSADWWRLRVFRSWSEDRYVYGWEDDAGRLRASLAYHVEAGGDDGRQLSVRYWDAADEEAYRAVLGFLRDHDSQVTTVQIVARDASLLDRLSDPGEADTSVEPGPMVRVVDVDAALSGLSTPADGERLILRVRDGRHAWNDGSVEVAADAGRTTCTRIETASVTGGEDAGVDVDVGIDVGALSRLVVGARSAERLAALGGVDGDTAVVRRLDGLVPVETPGPYLREFF
jgi:predicted acetyltransferase